jgi:uncharacterized protein YndB with AHSA1/START domain
VIDDEGTYHRELRIGAPPDVVFRYFTEPECMARWMGVDHKLEPVPGGAYMVDVNGRDAVALGQFVEVDPPRRLVFTFGWRDSPAVPPGSTTVEVNLTADGDGTVVDFTHRGLPVDERERHGDGWRHFLERLSIAAPGGDPGPDPIAGG